MRAGYFCIKNRLRFVLLLLAIGFFIPTIAQNLPPKTAAHIQSFSNTEKIKYLGDLCWSLRDKNNEEAIMYGQYAVALADSEGVYEEASRISNYLGVNMLYYRYDTKQAWHYFRDALSFGLKSQDLVQIGYAYDNIGYLYLIHSDAFKRIEQYKDCRNNISEATRRARIGMYLQ